MALKTSLDKILNSDNKTLEEENEAFFEILKNFDPKEVSSSKDLMKVFKVFQKVVTFKSTQQEEEIKTLKINLKKYQDPDHLTLSQQLMLSEQLLGTDSDDVILERDSLALSQPGSLKTSKMNFSQVDLYEMEERIRDLTEENYELQTVITNAKQVTEKYYKQVLQLKKEKSELKEEKQMLRQDFIKYRRQVETQWEDLIDNMEEKMQSYTERIHMLETQLTQAAEKVEDLVSRFKSKRNECYRVKKDLRETIKRLGSTRKYNANLKAALQSQDISNEMLRNLNEELKSKIISLQEKEKSRNETDEAIEKSVNEKVAEWQKILADKEEMLLDLQEKITQLKKNLKENTKNLPDAPIIRTLVEEISQKEEKISHLMMEKKFNRQLRLKNVETIKNIQSLFKKKTVHLREEIEEEKKLRILIEKQLQEVYTNVQEAEMHAFEKDKDLSDLLKRMRQYEKNYGIEEAVKEIESLQEKVRFRDSRVEELVKLVNDYDERLSKELEEKEKRRKKIQGN